MVPIRTEGGNGVHDYLREKFNSILPLNIFTYQKGISNPQYVPNIEIEIDTGNSEWTHELRPRMYYQEFSHNAMHAHAACTHWSFLSEALPDVAVGDDPRHHATTRRQHALTNL